MTMLKTKTDVFLRKTEDFSNNNGRGIPPIRYFCAENPDKPAEVTRHVVKFSEATGEMTVTVSHQDKVLGRWRTHWSPKGFPMLSQWVNPQKPTDKQKGFSHIFLIKFHLWALNHGFFLAQPSTARCVPSCIVRCTADHRWSWRWGTFPLLLSVLMRISIWVK